MGVPTSGVTSKADWLQAGERRRCSGVFWPPVLVVSLCCYSEMAGTKFSPFCLLPVPRAGLAGRCLAVALCASRLVPVVSLGVILCPSGKGCVMYVC